MKNIEELIGASQNLGISYFVLDGEEAKIIIDNAIKIFEPIKTSGHLSISNDLNLVIKIPLECNEFTYSEKLPKSKGYVFFDIYSSENKIFVLNDIRNLCKILSECYGMEYFVVDENFSYLIAVNWYVIEGAGLAMQYLAK